MPSQQELVEQNIRVLLGDLQLQLVFAKAQIATLEQLYAEAMAKQKVDEMREESAAGVEVPAKAKTNGAGIFVGDA